MKAGINFFTCGAALLKSSTKGSYDKNKTNGIARSPQIVFQSSAIEMEEELLGQLQIKSNKFVKLLPSSPF